MVGWYWRRMDNDYSESPQNTLKKKIDFNIPEYFGNFPLKHRAAQMAALQWPLGYVCFQLAATLDHLEKQLLPNRWYGLFSSKTGFCHCQSQSLSPHNALGRACMEKRGLLPPVCQCIKGSRRCSTWIWSNTLWSQWKPFPWPFIQFRSLSSSLCKS